MKVWFQNNDRLYHHPVYRRFRDAFPSHWLPVPREEDAELVLVPTVPNYDNQRPWLLFIEDWVTLYNPEIVNGATGNGDIHQHPRTRALREKFAHKNFMGIVCHHRETFDDLAALRLSDKVFYVPVGIPQTSIHPVGDGEDVTFLFLNSWLAGNGNFRPRGGEIVVRAFKELWDAGLTSMHLKLITGLPDDFQLKEFVHHCKGIDWQGNHQSDAALQMYVRCSDCLLLPSHRVHVHSLLWPMAHGLPVISSDGWGNQEYVIEEITGTRVPGILGRTSWRNGILREDYSRWESTLPCVRLVAAQMLDLIMNRDRLRRMGRNAWRYVQDVHSLERTSQMLAEII